MDSLDAVAALHYLLETPNISALPPLISVEKFKKNRTVREFLLETIETWPEVEFKRQFRMSRCKYCIFNFESES